MRGAVVGCALLAACGGGLEIDGTPGTPVAAVFEALLPYARARVEGGEEKLMICDSGAPMTNLDTGTFTGLAAGKLEVDIETLGVTFRDATVAAWNVPGDSGGLLGGDLLRHFAFTLDYRGSRLWLDGRPPADVATEAEVAVPLQLRGGGRSRLPGCSGPTCGTIDVPATRLLVKLRLEAASEAVWAVIDTGASGVVIDADLFATLAGARPKLEGGVVGTVDGNLPAVLSRVWRASLDGVAVDDLPIIVLAGSRLFSGLSAEVGVSVRALVGGHFLRPHLTTLDYRGRALRLARYLDQSHVRQDEFIGIGATFERDEEDWYVLDSFTNHDAYDQGIRSGDLLEEIDGMPVRGQPGEVLDAALARFGLGQRVPLVIRNVGGMHQLMVLVEDLLPHLTAPPGTP